MRRTPLLVFPLALLACASEGEELGEAAGAVVGGRPVVAYPSAGALQRSLDGDLPRMLCTGTLIGCDTFMTAAHCVCEGVEGIEDSPCELQTPPEELSVYFQHAGIIAVSAVEPHPDFEFPDNDIAILRLAEPVLGIRPDPLLRKNPALDATLSIVGFGITFKQGVDDGIKRAGELLRTACTEEDDELMLCYEPEESPTVSCNGDSGGPNYLEVDGVQHVTGIVSGGGTQESCTARQKFATLVSAHLDFIDAHSGALGSDECGDISSVSGPGSAVSVGTGEETWVNHSVEVPIGTAELRIGANARRGEYVRLSLAHEREPDYLIDDCGGDGRMSSYCEVLSPAPGTWKVVVSSDTPHQIAMTTLPGAPRAWEDEYESIAGSVLRVDEEQGLLQNDFGTRSPELRAEVSSPPMHGTVSIEANGAFSYQSDPEYVGNDSFRYRLHQEPYSAEATVYLDVREEERGDCGCQASTPRGSSGLVLVLLSLVAGRRRRRKR